MGAWDEALAACAPENGWAVDCYMGGAQPLPTGTPLDEALGGGLMPGVTVVGGQASAGKSSLACNVAANVAARGQRVLYLTLDDSWGNVTSRCMSAWSVGHHQDYDAGSFRWSDLPTMARRYRGLDLEWMRRAAWEGADSALACARAWDGGPGRCLAVMDSCAGVAAIEHTVRGLADAGEPPALVVVDYVQQYQSGVPELDRAEYSRVSEVASRLQRLALWGGIPLLELSSLRKLARGDDEPTLDWFRGSGVVGYAAWAAVVLTRGEAQGQGWHDIGINVVKNKAGRSGTAVSARLWGGNSYVGEVPK